MDLNGSEWISKYGNMFSVVIKNIFVITNVN